MKHAIIALVTFAYLLGNTGGTQASTHGELLQAVDSPASCPADRPVQKINMVTENGGRPAWSPDGKFIAFDRRNPDGYFALYIMTLDGNVVKSLTKDVFPIPQRHSGNPAWHPSGKYIVFEAEEEKHYDVIDKWPGNPGLGVYANFWAVTPDGKHYWKLTNTPAKLTLDDGLAFTGILNPHFTPDGTQMYWSERYAEGGKWGKWRIKMADLIDSANGPHLSNEHVIFQPPDGTGNYVTAMGLTGDSAKVLVAGNLDHQDEFGTDLYMLDLASGQFSNLTKTPDVWEEDSAIMPDGQHIIYMSNAGSPLNPADPRWFLQRFTREYWIMGMDGTNQHQLTCFNVPGSPEFIPQGAIVGAISFSPDGHRFAGVVGVNMGTKDRADYHLKLAIITLK
jgi:Tol biopolymer transport system component